MKAINDLVRDVMRDLPEGFEILVRIESNQVSVSLLDADGYLRDFETAEFGDVGTAILQARTAVVLDQVVS